MGIKQQYANISKLGKITTPYLGSTKDEPSHPGIDIANKNGTPIIANIKGKVIGISKDVKDFGNSLIVKDSKGNIHRYSHLKEIFMGKGGKFDKGTQIASMGDTGNSYSPTGGDASHVDYRVFDKKGKSINPIKFFK